MTQESVLLDTLQYYTGGINRRCKNEYMCYYHPKSVNKERISEGCAIGRLIPDDLKLELDNIDGNTGVDNEEVFKMLPNEIEALGQPFLKELQILHDVDLHWVENCLSFDGIIFLQSIIKTFSLNEEVFQEFLN